MQELKMISLTVTDIFTEMEMDSLCENKPITSSSISSIFSSPSSSSSISYQHHSLLSGPDLRSPSLHPCSFTSSHLTLTPQPPEGPLPPSILPSRSPCPNLLSTASFEPHLSLFPSYHPLPFLPTSSSTIPPSITLSNGHQGRESPCSCLGQTLITHTVTLG